jgi:hypothetical protein
LDPTIQVRLAKSRSRAISPQFAEPEPVKNIEDTQKYVDRKGASKNLSIAVRFYVSIN